MAWISPHLHTVPALRDYARARRYLLESVPYRGCKTFDRPLGDRKMRRIQIWATEPNSVRLLLTNDEIERCPNADIRMGWGKGQWRSPAITFHADGSITLSTGSGNHIRHATAVLWREVLWLLPHLRLRKAQERSWIKLHKGWCLFPASGALRLRFDDKNPPRPLHAIPAHTHHTHDVAKRRALLKRNAALRGFIACAKVAYNMARDDLPSPEAVPFFQEIKSHCPHSPLYHFNTRLNVRNAIESNDPAQHYALMLWLAYGCTLTSWSMKAVLANPATQQQFNRRLRNCVNRAYHEEITRKVTRVYWDHVPG